MVPRRILCGNKDFHERACVAFTQHKTYHVWTTILDLLYHVWTINTRLTTCGKLTVSCLDNPRVYILHENEYWHDKPRYNHAGRWIVANYVVLSVTVYFARKFDGKYAGSQQLKIEKLHQAKPSRAFWCQYCIVVKHHFKNISIM